MSHCGPLDSPLIGVIQLIISPQAFYNTNYAGANFATRGRSDMLISLFVLRAQCYHRFKDIPNCVSAPF
jgi:hypothetical protein